MVIGVCIKICTLSVMYSDSVVVFMVYIVSAESGLVSVLVMIYIYYGYGIYNQSGSHGIALYHSQLIVISKKKRTTLKFQSSQG